MRKIVTLLIGLAAVAYAAHWALNRSVRPSTEGPSSAKTRLDNVREKVRGFEEDDERRNKEALEKAEGK